MFESSGVRFRLFTSHFLLVIIVLLILELLVLFLVAVISLCLPNF